MFEKKLSFLQNRHVLQLSLSGFVLILWLLTSSSVLWAGTAGILRGRVVDKENGGPLIGVNIQLGGTTLGTSTDAEGSYQIGRAHV